MHTAEAPSGAELPPTADTPLLLSLTKVGYRGGWSRSFTYRLISKGILKVGKIAGRPMVATMEVDRVAAIIAAGGEL